MGIRGASAGNHQVYQFDAHALQSAPTNGAPLALLTGPVPATYARAFDDTTEEYVHGKFRVPDDLDTTGTVTFSAAVMAKTAAASKNVQHRFGHDARGDSEEFDALINKDSGDKAVDVAQDDISIHEWTETVANLGWAAGDLVLFRYSRIAPSSDNLSGDMYLLHLTIKIPV